MVRVKSKETIERNRVHGCLGAYLEGKSNLNWLMGVIRSTSVRGTELWVIFDDFKDHGDPGRYLEVRSACEDEGWMQGDLVVESEQENEGVAEIERKKDGNSIRAIIGNFSTPDWITALATVVAAGVAICALIHGCQVDARRQELENRVAAQGSKSEQQRTDIMKTQIALEKTVVAVAEATAGFELLVKPVSVAATIASREFVPGDPEAMGITSQVTFEFELAATNSKQGHGSIAQIQAKQPTLCNQTGTTEEGEAVYEHVPLAGLLGPLSASGGLTVVDRDTGSSVPPIGIDPGGTCYLQGTYAGSFAARVASTPNQIPSERVLPYYSTPLSVACSLEGQTVCLPLEFSLHDWSPVEVLVIATLHVEDPPICEVSRPFHF